MASIRVREDGRLFFDFRFQGVRCRELTTLKDTAANRKKMESVLRKIEREISNATFEYSRYFPTGSQAMKFARPSVVAPPGQAMLISTEATKRESALQDTPAFKDFVSVWVGERSIEWRWSYQLTVQHVLESRLLPEFGEVPIGEIDRAMVLAFRSRVAKMPCRVRNDQTLMLAPATINRIVGILRTILDEGAMRYGFKNPVLGIKRLKRQRTDIQPFTMKEMSSILANVRRDYEPYLRFRFLTGLRSGEVHGLKWKHIDFGRNEILIRETFQNNRTEYTKTNGSQREVYMSQPVRDALLEMRPKGFEEGQGDYVEKHVFRSRGDRPINNSNFNYRIWKPLLESLKIPYRRPYQMRHTCATFWLASGESPEWIARQLGHTTTEMLFRTYSRYVPNLMRKDGNAFDSFVSRLMNKGMEAANDNELPLPVGKVMTQHWRGGR